MSHGASVCASIEKGFSFSARSICRRKQDAQRLAGSADALDTRAESSRGKQRARTSAHECKAVPWVGVGGRCRSCGEGGRRVRDGPASNPPTAPPLDLSTINDHVGETKPLFGFGAILHASNRFAIINNIFLSRQNQYHVHHFARWGWRWGLAAGRWRCDLTVTATRRHVSQASNVQNARNFSLIVRTYCVYTTTRYEPGARWRCPVRGGRGAPCARGPPRRPPARTTQRASRQQSAETPGDARRTRRTPASSRQRHSQALRLTLQYPSAKTQERAK